MAETVFLGAVLAVFPGADAFLGAVLAVFPGADAFLAQ
jgi:hypothetical protein